uniref:Uncharacterized protein n=1 Tax=Opuntia streptacantha TaxID=393608 RepID=A0A7C8YP15_OPUST
MGLEKLLLERERRRRESRAPNSDGMYPVNPLLERERSVTRPKVHRTPTQLHGDASDSDHVAKERVGSAVTADFKARRERPSELSPDEREKQRVRIRWRNVK